MKRRFVQGAIVGSVLVGWGFALWQHSIPIVQVMVLATIVGAVIIGCSEIG